MRNHRNRKLFSLLITASVLFNVSFAPGQNRRAPRTPANQPVKNSKKAGCIGGWSGVVTLTKTLKDSLESDEPGIRKAKDRIKHKTSRDYNYTAKAVVDGSAPPNVNVKAQVAFSDKDLNWGEERVWDTCNSRESGHWFIIEGIDNRQTTAQATGSARDFYLSVDESNGTYNFNIAFPEANGTYNRVQQTNRSGHCQAKNNEPYNKTDNEATKIKGESFSIYGEKIDPNQPDKISGSKTWGDDGTGAVRSFVYQATWSFTRCPQKLLISDLRFEHPDFPNWEDWKEIEELRGTTDGNPVKIKAKVLNLSAEAKFAEISFKETYKGDRWNGSLPDLPLKNSAVSIRLDPGEEREVDIEWNSSGYSWFDDGRPRDLLRIKAEAWENNQLKDEMMKNLRLAPKPVVLVHGLWSSAAAWIPLYQNLLTTSHSYGWKAYPVGERPQHGKLNTGGSFLSSDKTNSIYDNADQLKKYIDYAQEESNAWHVDIVAHSLGGLISRLYIHKSMPIMPDDEPLVKHLVMLGTPNAGSPCADTIDMKFRLFNENVQAVKDLKPENVALFNQYVRERKGVKFSALAGNPVPVMCGGYFWNDGVVSVDSAKHGIEDFAYSNDLHTDLTDARNFGNFVLPHLLTGPKGTYPRPVRSDPNDIDRWKIGSSLFENNFFINASFVPVDDSNKGSDPQNFSTEVKLAPKQKLEVDVPVEAAQNLGVTFLAGSDVSVSLIDPAGKVAAENPANSPLSFAVFRTLFYKKAVVKGVWKLKIENSSDLEQMLLAFSWSAKNLEINAKNAAE